MIDLKKKLHSVWTELSQLLDWGMRSWTKLKTQTPEKADQITSSIFYLQSVDSQELFQWTKKFLQTPYSKNNAVYNVRDRRFCAAAHWYLIFANDVTQSVHDKTDMQAKKLLTFSFSWVMEKAIAESPYSALQAKVPERCAVLSTCDFLNTRHCGRSYKGEMYELCTVFHLNWEKKRCAVGPWCVQTNNRSLHSYKWGSSGKWTLLDPSCVWPL